MRPKRRIGIAHRLAVGMLGLAICATCRETSETSPAPRGDAAAAKASSAPLRRRPSKDDAKAVQSAPAPVEERAMRHLIETRAAGDLPGSLTSASRLLMAALVEGGRLEQRLRLPSGHCRDIAAVALPPLRRASISIQPKDASWHITRAEPEPEGYLAVRDGRDCSGLPAREVMITLKADAGQGLLGVMIFDREGTGP